LLFSTDCNSNFKNIRNNNFECTVLSCIGLRIIGVIWGGDGGKVGECHSNTFSTEEFFFFAVELKRVKKENCGESEGKMADVY